MPLLAAIEGPNRGGGMPHYRPRGVKIKFEDSINAKWLVGGKEAWIRSGNSFCCRLS
jgi:hypothetical protein